MDSKLLETAFNALARWPIVQAAFAILILTVAYVMVMKGLREKTAAAVQPPPVPVQVESPWLVIELNTISVHVQDIKRAIDRIHQRIDSALRDRGDHEQRDRGDDEH